MAFQSPLTHNQGTVPPPSAPGVSGQLPGQGEVNKTRILSLQNFSKDLKTRDIQNMFVEYEEDRGGYRIKWLDDTGCLIVFNDALTAKRAFLNLLANPHPHLLPYTNAEGEQTEAKLAPYNEPDAAQIIGSVQNRPRSRSIAQNNNATGHTNGNGINTSPMHNRRLSNSSGHARGASNSSALNGVGSSMNGTRSFGRASMSQHQMNAIIDEASASTHNDDANTSPTSTSPTSASNNNGGAIDWSNHQQQPRSRGSSTSQFSQPAVGGQYGSPERGAGAISPSRRLRVHQLANRQ